MENENENKGKKRITRGKEERETGKEKSGKKREGRKSEGKEKENKREGKWEGEGRKRN